MALSGLQIFKLLPKTNCKKCGRPTCLAFAMQIAQKKADLSECPDVSEEAKQTLASAAAPPMATVAIGSGDNLVKVGGETELFRHESTFSNPCGVAITLSDSLDDSALAERAKTIGNLTFTRVGLEIKADVVAVLNESGDDAKFAAAAAKAAVDTGMAIALVSESADAMAAALEACADKAPLLHAATEENAEAMAALAKQHKCPLAVKADSLEKLAELTEKVKGLGATDIVVDVTGKDVRETLLNLTIARRAALRKSFRPLGYPTIVFAHGEDAVDRVVDAGTYIAKYGGVVVVDAVEPWQVLPLLTVRQNIYTDPQKPIQVEPKLYTVGEADENSPVMFTTNFSLTYYSVEGEVEASRVPSYILAVDTEGTSVLTAYSGDKLNEKIVAKAMKDAAIENVVKHRKIIIPGYVAVMSGKLEEESGWDVLVGPKEAAMLPTYLKNVWSKQSSSN